MRVAVDVSPLSRPRTGVGTYLRGLVRGLAAILGDEDSLAVFALASGRGSRGIAGALAGVTAERRIRRVPYPHGWRTAWSRLGRPPVELLAGRADAVHLSDWMHPPQRGGVRATTVCDLVPLRFPQWTTPRTRRMLATKLDDAARTCDIVFAISRFTAADVTDRLGIEAARVRVAYPGVESRYRPDGDREERAAPYVLAVGTLEPRKNLDVLPPALALVRRARPELELLHAGPEGWGERPDLRGPGVVSLGFVGEERLARLYRGAAALAYPSRFEGFGLPVVEAMASGVPVVASSHPSLDEACGEAAIRADPESPEAFAAALEQALTMPDEPRRLGLEHARRFTWEACARAVLEGYRSAL